MPKPGEISSAPPGLLGGPTDSLGELKTFFEGQFQSFKNEMKRSNDEAIQRAVKRFRGEQRSKHVFKSKGNEEQFKNQEETEVCIDDALEALDSGNCREAKAALEEGKALIATRKKHIILADMHGWDFVNEYKDIPIAEDDGDEKRIRKVLKTVESKREKKRAEKAKKASTAKPSFQARNNSLFSVRPTNDMSNFSLSGGCYLCGKLGHFWRACSFNRSRSSFGQQSTSIAGRQLVPLQPATTVMPPQSKLN